jgi:type I restriction enzyme S subunit
MKFEKFKNIIDIQKGKKPSFIETPDENSVRILQIDDLRNDNTPKFTNDKSGVLAKEDDVLIAWDGANAGTIGYGKSGYIGSTIALLRKKKPDLYSTTFIGKFLQSQHQYLRGKTTGATIPHISRKALEDLEIPIISISDQLHIANLLTKAEKLISQRKESIRLLDEFLKSTFLEMFGDPVRNEKRFNKGRFGGYLKEIIAGSSYGGEYKGELKDDEFGVLKVSAVTRGVFNPKEFKAINMQDIKGEIIHPAKGDLLFSRANTRELVGATCIVDKDYPKLFLPDKLWNIKLNENELNKVFVHFLFQNKSFKNILTHEASGTSGSMLNISMEKLRNIKFPKPPISLQTQFAQIVEKTEALKIQYQQSLQELENLYGSLSQRAFRGELGLIDQE